MSKKPEALQEPPGTEVREAKHREVQKLTAAERLQREIDEVESYRMPLMEHLIELKNRLIWAVAALVLGSGVGIYYAKEIYHFLAKPFLAAGEGIEGIEVKLVLVTSPIEGIFTYFKLGFLAGAVIASPVISYHMWSFVAPGLYKNERRFILPLTVASVVLFLGGGAFCYYVIFPFAFPFFIHVLDLDVNLSADGYLTSVMWMMLAFGASFQLPVVAWAMARVGLIDAKDMIASFRYAIVVIFVVAAILTPPDPLTQILLALPLTALYLLAIVIVWFASTKVREPPPDDEKKDEAKPPPDKPKLPPDDPEPPTSDS